MREPGDPKMAETFRAAREAKRLTRREVAEAVGMNDQYLYQIESGLRKPALEKVWDLAVYLDLDPHALDERLAPRPKRGRKAKGE